MMLEGGPQQDKSVFKSGVTDKTPIKTRKEMATTAPPARPARERASSISGVPLDADVEEEQFRIRRARADSEDNAGVGGTNRSQCFFSALGGTRI